MKPRGKPFEKGTDTRRNDSGQRNKAAVSFARTVRELIVRYGEKKRKLVDANGKLIANQKNIEWVVQALYKEAMGGNMAAVNVILDRVEGKVTLPLEHSGNITYTLDYVNDWRDEANQTADAAFRAKDDTTEPSALQVGERGTEMAQNDNGAASIGGSGS